METNQGFGPWTSTQLLWVLWQRTGNTARIVLTVAHLDHTPENCSLDNLRALCQRCHNRYDAEHRKETRLNNSIKKKEKWT